MDDTKNTKFLSLMYISSNMRTISGFDTNNYNTGYKPAHSGTNEPADGGTNESADSGIGSVVKPIETPKALIPRLAQQLILATRRASEDVARRKEDQSCRRSLADCIRHLDTFHLLVDHIWPSFWGTMSKCFKELTKILNMR